MSEIGLCLGILALANSIWALVNSFVEREHDYRAGYEKACKDILKFCENQKHKGNQDGI